MSGLGTVCVRLAFFWAGNPFKNQAKRKVWKSQFLRKPANLAGNPELKKSQILAPNYYLKSVTFENFFEKSISPYGI